MKQVFIRSWALREVALAFVMVIILVGCEAKKSSFELSDLVIREMAPNREIAVAYLSIENHDDKNLTLNYVHSPVADRIEVHRHLYSNGQMQMREVKHLSIDPKARLDFSPGGHHLMLFGVYERLQEGEQVEITFEFEQHPPKTAIATVKRM